MVYTGEEGIRRQLPAGAPRNAQESHRGVQTASVRPAKGGRPNAYGRFRSWPYGSRYAVASPAPRDKPDDHAEILGSFSAAVSTATMFATLPLDGRGTTATGPVLPLPQDRFRPTFETWAGWSRPARCGLGTKPDGLSIVGGGDLWVDTM
jgi:hypothetical protein